MSAGVLSTHLYVVKTFFEEFILQLKVQNLEKKAREMEIKKFENNVTENLPLWSINLVFAEIGINLQLL